MTEVVANKHLVMYPDGGCRGTERNAGAGAHGGAAFPGHAREHDTVQR